MNTKLLATLALAAGLAAAGLFLARAQTGTAAAPADPRLDKLIEQNEQILKHQQEILKTLGELRQDILQLRRRTS